MKVQRRGRVLGIVAGVSLALALTPATPAMAGGHGH
ncbi:MAG: hypothetical protein JWO46_1257, partial [Nocardioidaceae bacterium]|nr:hypothetical protein [Nocardioidaceae bacterium]